MRIFVLLFVCFCSIKGYSQDEDFRVTRNHKSDFLCFAQTGIGILPWDNNYEGLVRNYSAYLVKRNMLVSVRHSWGANDKFSSNAKYSEWGILYGFSYRIRSARLFASAGISHSKGKYLGWFVNGSAAHDFDSYGVPYEFGAMYTISPYFGIGTQVIGTQRKHADLPGVMATLQIGKIASSQESANSKKKESRYTPYYFVQTGTTVNFNDGEWNIMNVSSNMMVDHHLMSVRYAEGEGIEEDADPGYREWAFLYGRGYASRWGFVSASIGISQVKGEYLIGSDATRSYKKMGIPLELQVIFTPIPYCGIGIKLIHTDPRNSPGDDLMYTIQIGHITYWNH